MNDTLLSFEEALEKFDPALADDRCYRVGAALEAALLEQWGGPLLDKAPTLEGGAR